MARQSYDLPPLDLPDLDKPLWDGEATSLPVGPEVAEVAQETPSEAVAPVAVVSPGPTLEELKTAAQRLAREYPKEFINLPEIQKEADRRRELYIQDNRAKQEGRIAEARTQALVEHLSSQDPDDLPASVLEALTGIKREDAIAQALPQVRAQVEQTWMERLAQHFGELPQEEQDYLNSYALRNSSEPEAVFGEFVARIKQTSYARGKVEAEANVPQLVQDQVAAERARSRAGARAPDMGSGVGEAAITSDEQFVKDIAEGRSNDWKRWERLKQSSSLDRPLVP